MADSTAGPRLLLLCNLARTSSVLLSKKEFIDLSRYTFILMLHLKELKFVQVMNMFELHE